MEEAPAPPWPAPPKPVGWPGDRSLREPTCQDRAAPQLRRTRASRRGWLRPIREAGAAPPGAAGPPPAGREPRPVPARPQSGLAQGRLPAFTNAAAFIQPSGAGAQQPLLAREMNHAPPPSPSCDRRRRARMRDTRALTGAARSGRRPCGLLRQTRGKGTLATWTMSAGWGSPGRCQEWRGGPDRASRARGQPAACRRGTSLSSGADRTHKTGPTRLVCYWGGLAPAGSAWQCLGHWLPGTRVRLSGKHGGPPAALGTGR